MLGWPLQKQKKIKTYEVNLVVRSKMVVEMVKCPSITHLKKLWNIQTTWIYNWRNVARWHSLLCVPQATTLLTMDKYSMQDVKNIHNTCFKLNSLQLHALMTNYHCAPDEPYIPPVSQKKHTSTIQSICDSWPALCRSSQLFHMSKIANRVDERSCWPGFVRLCSGADRPRGGGGREHGRWAGEEWRERGAAAGGSGPPAALPSSGGRLFLRCGAQPPQRPAGLPGATAAERWLIIKNKSNLSYISCDTINFRFYARMCSIL